MRALAVGADPQLDLESIPNTERFSVVVSVNGRTGNVTLTPDDVGLETHTGLTGGGDTDLDGEETTSLPVNTTLRFVVVSGAMSVWQLVSGTNAEDLTIGIVRPDDFNASTNAKVWKRVLGF